MKFNNTTVKNFNGFDIRVTKDPLTEVSYFCVRDIVNALGVTNYTRMWDRVDENHKKQENLSIVRHANPQKYWVVDKYGLASIVFRATKSQVNPTEFFKWSERITEQKDTLWFCVSYPLFAPTILGIDQLPISSGSSVAHK